MNLQQDFIAIKLKDDQEKTPGGVFIPTTSPSPFREGQVIATSQGVSKDGDYIETPVVIGDTVVIHASAGMKYIDGLHLIQFGNVIEVRSAD